MSVVLETPTTFLPRPRLLSVEIYDSMIRNGILTENDNVELLNGIIIEKMPKGKRHAYINDAITDFLRDRLADRAVVRNQNPILLDDYSEPEPDIVVCMAPREKYLSQHPQPSDILLLIEVSDTTIYFDRGEKGLSYSKAGIQQYLIVNVENDTVEDYSQPGDDGYQSRQTYYLDQKVPLVAFPDIELNLGEFTPVSN